MRWWRSGGVAACVVLAGCLLVAKQPFGVHLENDAQRDWTGRLLILDDDGDVRFDETVTAADDELLDWEIGELVGEFTFIVEAEGQRWEQTVGHGRGDDDWTVVVGVDGICFGHHFDDYDQETCPVPRPA